MKRIIVQNRIQNPVKHPRWSSSVKVANGLNMLTNSAKISAKIIAIRSKYIDKGNISFIEVDQKQNTPCL